MIASCAIPEGERKSLPAATNSSSHLPARQCLLQELSLDTWSCDHLSFFGGRPLSTLSQQRPVSFCSAFWFRVKIISSLWEMLHLFSGLSCPMHSLFHTWQNSNWHKDEIFFRSWSFWFEVFWCSFGTVGHLSFWAPPFSVCVGLNLIFIHLHFCKRKSLEEVVVIF